METLHVPGRLRIIEGQVRGIIRLVEQDGNRTEILHQITAVRAALEQVGFILLQNHIEQWWDHSVQQGPMDGKMDELISIWKQFSKI
ncbi:metal-sensitive transcriptional regulator [Paenibacillus sp. BR2-3]|uniref:metal-sensitive transcriptional regulator n=1 Tax=Paenibacillus sp. BR2-3 TaxID=3048494 RepID=UPI0039776B65